MSDDPKFGDVYRWHNPTDRGKSDGRLVMQINGQRAIALSRAQPYEVGALCSFACTLDTPDTYGRYWEKIEDATDSLY